MNFTRLSRLMLCSTLLASLLVPISSSALPPLDSERYPPEQPPGSAPGGFRRGCLPGDQFPSRFALVPEAYGHGGLTQSEQPTLWFYLPVDLAGAPAENRTITLKLYTPSSDESVPGDEQVQIERIIFPMPTLQAGIVGISLEGSNISLPIDALLFWEVAIHCGGPLDLRDSIDPPITTSWIRRVVPLSDDIAPGSAAPANADAAVALSQLYLENGIWYNAVNVLSVHMLGDLPTDEIRTAWQQLVIDSEVENVVNETTIQVIEIGE